MGDFLETEGCLGGIIKVVFVGIKESLKTIHILLYL